MVFGMSLPAHCDGACAVGYVLRWPSWPFDAGDYIQFGAAVIAIVVVVAAEVRLRRYVAGQRTIAARTYYKPLDVSGSEWSFVNAGHLMDKRVASARADLGDRTISVLTQLAVVFGVLAGLPYFVFVVAFVLVFYAWRLRIIANERRWIDLRAAIFSTIISFERNSTATVFFFEEKAARYIDELFSMTSDLLKIDQTMNLALIESGNSLRAYAAEQAARNRGNS